MWWVLDSLRGLAFGCREYLQSALGLADNQKRLVLQLNRTLPSFAIKSFDSRSRYPDLLTDEADAGWILRRFNGAFSVAEAAVIGACISQKQSFGDIGSHKVLPVRHDQYNRGSSIALSNIPLEPHLFK